MPSLNIMGRKTRVIYLLRHWWTAKTMHRQFILPVAPSKLRWQHRRILHRIHSKYVNLRTTHVQNLHFLLSLTRSNNIFNSSFICGYIKLYVVRFYDGFLTWNKSHDFWIRNGPFIRAKLRSFIHGHLTFLFIWKVFKFNTLTQCRLLLTYVGLHKHVSVVMVNDLFHDSADLVSDEATWNLQCAPEYLIAYLDPYVDARRHCFTLDRYKDYLGSPREILFSRQY